MTVKEGADGREGGLALRGVQQGPKTGAKMTKPSWPSSSKAVVCSLSRLPTFSCLRPDTRRCIYITTRISPLRTTVDSRQHHHHHVIIAAIVVVFQDLFMMNATLFRVLMSRGRNDDDTTSKRMVPGMMHNMITGMMTRTPVKIGGIFCKAAADDSYCRS